jgi:hypothetical protein
MFSDPDPFLRNTDGMIDFDRYRSEASALRRHAMQATSALTSAVKLVVAVVLLLALIAVAPSTKDDTATAGTTSGRTASQGASGHPALF